MLLGWGNDFIRATDRYGRDAWTNEFAKRDAAVIFVPPDPLFDATAAWLQGHGVKVLG